MTKSDAGPVDTRQLEISVIVPVCNKSRNIQALLKRLVPVLELCAASFEIIFVDDGSTDDTLGLLRAAHAADPRILALSLSRNFGKEIAITAGIDHVRGAATIIMDADLQHPPELIETFVARWKEGYKNVFAQRIDPNTYSPLRRLLTQRFYKLFGSVGETRLPEGAGDFRLLDAQAVAALRMMREHARFSKGLYAWIGFKSIGVPFDVEARLHGVSKFSYRKLTHLALDETHVLFDIASQGMELYRLGHIPAGADIGEFLFDPHSHFRRRCARLCLVDCLDYVFCRNSVAVAWHHRRIYRPHLRRS